MMMMMMTVTPSSVITVFSNRNLHQDPASMITSIGLNQQVIRCPMQDQ
jgi:hypothetical protein